MIRVIKLLFYRWSLDSMSTEVAESLGLKFYRNLYGDEAMIFHCRSLWTDEEDRIYYVTELFDERKLANDSGR